MGKKLTVYDIAEEAGVSAATVSRVLTGNVQVKGKTKEKVLAIINKHNFQPSSVARSLKARRSKMIGFIVPDITNPFFSQLFLEVEIRATEHDYTVILCNSHSNSRRESQILDTFLAKEVEAIIFSGGRIDNMQITKGQLQEIERVNQFIPLITCSELPGGKCIQMINNERQGIYTIVEHLYSLGHRSLGMIGGRDNVLPSHKRRMYMIEAAQQYGMTVKKDWLIQGEFSISAGAECMDQLLSQLELPTAVMAFNDVVAIGALSTLHRHGYTVPDDMALTGYDGIPLTQTVVPSITTMAAPFAYIADRIMATILSGESAGQISETVVDLQLVVGESTGRNVRAV